MMRRRAAPRSPIRSRAVSRGHGSRRPGSCAWGSPAAWRSRAGALRVIRFGRCPAPARDL